MEVLDFDGTCSVESDQELLVRLHSVRRGAYGAFILDHGGEPSLWVHMNGDIACLHYFADKKGRHAGFVADWMWPGEPCEPVGFRLIGVPEGGRIEVPWWQLVTLEAAYRAAIEFLQSPSLPASVTWMEL